MLGMHCRQRQQLEQQTLTITDILSACPRLLQVTAAASKKCLAATSKELRRLVHSTIKMLTGCYEEDLQLLHRSNWPELGLVILKGHPHGMPHTAPCSPHIPILACIWLHESKPRLGNFMVLLTDHGHSVEHSMSMLEHVVRPERWNKGQLELGHIKSAEVGVQIIAKLCQLQRTTWSQLKVSDLYTLSLHNMHIDAAVMKQLFHLHLPKMHILNIDYCQLSSDANSKVPKQQWPCLNIQSLAGNTLTDKIFCDGICFPWLVKLDLCLNRSRLDTAAIEHLVASPWSLEELDLACNALNDDGIKVLTRGNWPNLYSLQLDFNCLRRKPTADMLGLDMAGQDSTSWCYKLPRQHGMLWPKLTEVSTIASPYDWKHSTSC